jgi:hypothetical protein
MRWNECRHSSSKSTHKDCASGSDTGRWGIALTRAGARASEYGKPESRSDERGPSCLARSRHPGLKRDSCNIRPCYLDDLAFSLKYRDLFGTPRLHFAAQRFPIQADDFHPFARFDQSHSFPRVRLSEAG